MSDQICSIADIQAKARSAFQRGLTINDHNMNPGAAALVTWQAEYASCEAEAAWCKASDREIA